MKQAGHIDRRWSLQTLPCVGSQVKAVQSHLGDVHLGDVSLVWILGWVVAFPLLWTTNSERLGAAVQRKGHVALEEGLWGRKRQTASV